MEAGQSACQTHAHEASAAAELEHTGASGGVRALRWMNEDTGTWEQILEVVMLID